MSTNKEFKKFINIHIRVSWNTTSEYAFDDDATDEAYATVKQRIEDCLSSSVCGQVGAIPGTEQMELKYGVYM